jgi:AcrR family transcriptional regulator
MAAAATSPAEPARAPVDYGLPTHMYPMSFIERLDWRLANDPPRQKGQRTRERLKLACARLLDRGGFHNLRAGDVSAEANLAEGSFYLYFSDKRDITRTVLSAFQDMFFGLQLGPGDRGNGSAFDSVRVANRAWFAYARANAGLLRCLYQFADEDTAFGAEVQKQNMRWHLKVMRSSQRRGAPGGGTGLTDQESLLLVYLLGGMMDDLARRLIVYPDPELIGLIAKMGVTDETLADVATLIWVRILQPAETPPQQLSDSAGAIARLLFPTVSAA